MSLASSSSSSSLIVWSPTARSTLKSTSSPSPNPCPVAARAVVPVRVRVVSLRPSPLRPAHAGSRTPYPAAWSNGAARRRNPNAHAVSTTMREGVAVCRAVYRSGQSRTARPRPASSVSSGRLGRPGTRLPSHSREAGTYRLGSSTDWRANSSSQASSSPSGSLRRKQTRMGPSSWCAESIQSRSALPRRLTSLGSASGSAASPPVRASSHRSARGLLRPARLPRRSRSGSDRRVAPSASPPRASCSTRAAGRPSPAARQAGGIAVASSRKADASTPVITGRQRAAWTPSSITSWGSTLPRRTRARACSATTAR